MHFAIVIFLFYHIFDPVHGDGRIFGGSRVNIEKVPYMAHVRYLEEDGIYVVDCGGSILTKNLILTAGHCTLHEKSRKQYTANRFRIRVGSTYQESQGKVHRVVKVFTHPDYDRGAHNDHHDIAILQLKHDIKFSKTAQPTQLADANDKICVGADTVVNGWGDNPDHPDDEDHLYQVHLRVVNSTECAERYGDSKEFGEHEICVQGNYQSDCEGDSGGPLTYTKTGRQIGVVSYGGDTCTNNLPTVFCKVQDNLDFINSVKQQTGNKAVTGQRDC